MHDMLILNGTVVTPAGREALDVAVDGTPSGQPVLAASTTAPPTPPGEPGDVASTTEPPPPSSGGAGSGFLLGLGGGLLVAVLAGAGLWFGLRRRSARRHR